MTNQSKILYLIGNLAKEMRKLLQFLISWTLLQNTMGGLNNICQVKEDWTSKFMLLSNDFTGISKVTKSFMQFCLSEVLSTHLPLITLPFIIFALDRKIS